MKTYGYYSKTIEADVFSTFNCTFWGEKSIMTCFTQAHRDQIVGMLFVRQKLAIVAMHFGISQSTVSDVAGLVWKEAL